MCVYFEAHSKDSVIATHCCCYSSLSASCTPSVFTTIPCRKNNCHFLQRLCRARFKRELQKVISRRFHPKELALNLVGGKALLQDIRRTVISWPKGSENKWRFCSNKLPERSAPPPSLSDSRSASPMPWSRGLF